MSLLNPISEKELVERLQAGDQTAISVLYDNYSPALYGIILRIVRCEKTAEDLLQDCFVKIWVSFSSYDLHKAKLFTWLIRVAHNAAIDAMRSAHHKKSLRTSEIDEDMMEGSIDCSTFNPNHIGLKDLTQVLSPEQKEVIDLLFFNGYTHAEVAEELNIPLGTVKNRSRSAIIKLRKFFK